MAVFSPADPGETAACLRLTLQRRQPAYLRLGKAGEAQLYQTGDLAQGPVLVRGSTAPIAFAAMGSILKSALRAAELLAQRGIETAVYSCPIIGDEFCHSFTVQGYRKPLPLPHSVQ